MADALHKFVAWTLSPLGVFFLSCAVALVIPLASALRARRRPSFPCIVLLAALVFLWIMGCGVTTRVIGAPLEGKEVSLEELSRGISDIDVLVLLGGGMGFHEKCGRPEMASSADRVWTAAKLWRKGMSVTVSGGYARASTVPLLRDLGVDESCVVDFESAKNTEDEARLIGAWLAAEGRRPRVALVTSAWHMPRARMLFERAGVEVFPCPTDYEMVGKAESPLAFGDFVPDAEALRFNSYAAKEWVARVCYAVKFW